MANKYQALTAFWNSFDWSAYDALTVPDDVQLPYITFEAPSDHIGQNLAVTTSLYDRSNAWERIVNKSEEIVQAVTRGGRLIPYDDGAIWIRWGTPLSQRLREEGDDSIRHIVLNFELEFLD